MKAAFQIGTIRGIPIRVHTSFLVAFPLFALVFGNVIRSAASLAGVPPERLSGNAWLWGAAIAAALFASVLAHELAHALYARRRGGHVRDITLYVIGGATRLTGTPARPRHEAVMALVGPLVSVLLAGLFYLAYRAVSWDAFELRFALFYLGALNAFLAAFNLLPAFPMDGGRILRAGLASRFGAVRATQIASSLGKFFAMLFALWGVLTFNVILLLIAFFVYVGAESELRGMVMNDLLGTLRIRDVMREDVASLPAAMTVQDAADRMVRERRLWYAVLDDGATPRILTLPIVQAVAPARRAEVRVRDVAIATPALAPSDDATLALRAMSEQEVPCLVTDGERIIGAVTPEDLGRILALSELATPARPRALRPIRET